MEANVEDDGNVIGMNLLYEETQQTPMNDVQNDIKGYVTEATHDTNYEDVESNPMKKVRGKNKPNQARKGPKIMKFNNHSQANQKKQLQGGNIIQVSWQKTTLFLVYMVLTGMSLGKTKFQTTLDPG